MSEPRHTLAVAGIGASAGGIPALQGFFKGLPDDSGMAFVIVTHLSPDRESLLHEVVSRYTTIPVKVIEDGQKLERNTVYVMPENAVVTTDGDILQLREPNPARRERKPIDIFFASLAEAKGEYAVGIILSGGDGDGTLGAKAIKERGGLTVAQRADSYGPKHPEMPESALATGMIDLELPVHEMGTKLVTFVQSFGMLDELTRDDKDQGANAIHRARDEIYGLLVKHSGHDFSGYKTKTFMRRVQRRLQVRQLQSIEAYIELLRKDASEVMSLFRDLLINVTDFFRDEDAFRQLEQIVIPKLFEGKLANDTVRVWVPGCATGEEVFSIGILMREYMDRLTVVPKVQIFATDIDEQALSVARSGRYPAQLLSGISEPRRQRFFVSDGGAYQVKSEVREMCIFSPHSVIRDPPFSRMDLVSCRNLLIYFGPDIQHRVIPTFHYSLKPGGYLFLGTSEGVSQHGELFAMVDKKQRIFQAREHSGHQRRLPQLIDGRLPQPSEDRRDKSGLVSVYPLRQIVEAQVLDRFAPAHVVVNGEGDVVYYSSRTGRFLEPPQGAPSRQLLSMARRGLRLELRSALREAVTSQQPVMRERLIMAEDDGDEHLVTVTVEPLADRGNGEPLYLVLFHPLGPVETRPQTAAGTADAQHAADLERELRDTRERLQATIEEYETAVEELKSSNEELVSMNEEVQSTNEELEASKEEMQSLNEELNTINAELSSKVEELDSANNDLQNLFESAQIATVFLDRNLVIRNFTPVASAFFNLRSADIGRPLTDLTTRLDYPGLETDIKSVFATGEPLEQQLPRSEDGKFLLVRLRPYRDDTRSIEGVVVSLVDVTTLAEAEEHQQVLISELNHRVKNMLAVAISIAKQTLTLAPAHPAHEALIGRMRAMASAYGALSRVNWRRIAIDEIIHQELDPFGAERISLCGPEVLLEPQPALSLGMVMHELATNAAKYGALSQAAGSVAIEWQYEQGNLALTWTERGGPPVTKSDKSGFGLTLLEGEIGYRLGGKVETRFEPAGLEVRLEVPLTARGTS